MNPMMNPGFNFQIRYPYPSNPFSYPIQPTQPPAMYPMLQNPNQPFISQPHVFPNPMMINQNDKTNVIQANNPISTNKVDLNNQTVNETHSSFYNMKILSKYKDIYVPTIFLIDYNDVTKNPFNILIQTQKQQVQPNFPTAPGGMMNNLNTTQNNQLFSKYFNYGYNFDQWKKYVNDMKSKFDELNDLVKSNKIILPELEADNELEYLMALPSDYGGLGEVYKDQNYENVKFFDPKDASKNKGNKDFMSMIKFEHETWFPLEPNQSFLNKNINNDIFKYINPSVNPFQQILTNPNSTTVSKSENNQLGNNSNIKDEANNKTQ